MKKPIDNNKILDEYELCKADNAVSAQETTGLIPSLALSDEEIDSYKAIDEFMQSPVCKRGKYNNPQDGQ